MIINKRPDRIKQWRITKILAAAAAGIKQLEKIDRLIAARKQRIERDREELQLLLRKKQTLVDNIQAVQMMRADQQRRGRRRAIPNNLQARSK